MITIEQVNTYFSAHLDAAYWSGLTESIKTAALTMASNDVCAELNLSEIDTTSGYQSFAVCEQAVFIARNYSKQTGGKVVTSQSLDGFGSQSFTLLNAGHPGISPRAMDFIKRAKRQLLSRPLRISRG